MGRRETLEDGNFNDLSSRERIRKKNYRRDMPRSDRNSRALTKAVPSFAIPTFGVDTASPIHQIASNLRELGATLSLEQSLLLEKFVLRNGPQAVISSIRNALSKHDELPPTNLKAFVMMDATGIIHERLAHLWLSDQREDQDTIVLDPGSAERVSRSLRWLGETPSLDGMIITGVHSRPTIAAFCEYKTNPNGPNVPEHLQKQITLIRGFRERFAGQEFNMTVPIDRVRQLGRRLAIAREPEILLVIPEDRRVFIAEDVDVLNTPFYSYMIAEIAHRCTQHLLTDNRYFPQT